MSSLTAQAGKTPGREPGKEAAGGSAVTCAAKPCSWSRDCVLTPGFGTRQRGAGSAGRRAGAAAAPWSGQVSTKYAQRSKVETRGKSVADPPSPIPNLVVKRYSADGTASSRGWESRPPRVSLLWRRGAAAQHAALSRLRPRVRIPSLPPNEPGPEDRSGLVLSDEQPARPSPRGGSRLSAFLGRNQRAAPARRRVTAPAARARMPLSRSQSSGDGVLPPVLGMPTGVEATSAVPV